MTESPSDVPGVIVFPPLIPLAVLVLGVALQWLAPLGVLAHIPLAVRVVTSVLAVGLGLGMVIVADRTFKHIGTNVRPTQPALALATTGIFSRVRNPMYVGGSLALLGIALGFSLDWALLLWLASLPLLHYGIVLREERYLERKFGDDYRRYKANVPRYGGPT
jgi:protein-S-isoprenylcysteine O-methyltransferase Ste14